MKHKLSSLLSTTPVVRDGLRIMAFVLLVMFGAGVITCILHTTDTVSWNGEPKMFYHIYGSMLSVTVVGFASVVGIVYYVRRTAKNVITAKGKGALTRFGAEWTAYGLVVGILTFAATSLQSFGSLAILSASLAIVMTAFLFISFTSFFIELAAPLSWRPRDETHVC